MVHSSTILCVPNWKLLVYCLQDINWIFSSSEHYWFLCYQFANLIAKSINCKKQHDLLLKCFIWLFARPHHSHLRYNVTAVFLSLSKPFTSNVVMVGVMAGDCCLIKKLFLSISHCVPYNLQMQLKVRFDSIWSCRPREESFLNQW